MSDLLPLVVAVFQDKAAADALEELIQLQKDLAVSRSVEIIHAAADDWVDEQDEEGDVVVYASAQFQNGE